MTIARKSVLSFLVFSFLLSFKWVQAGESANLYPPPRPPQLYPNPVTNAVLPQTNSSLTSPAIKTFAQAQPNPYPTTPGLPYTQVYVKQPFLNYTFANPGDPGTYWAIFADSYFYNDQCPSVAPNDPILNYYPDILYICQIVSYPNPPTGVFSGYAYTSQTTFATIAAPLWFTGQTAPLPPGYPQTAATLLLDLVSLAQDGAVILAPDGTPMTADGFPLSSDEYFCAECGDPVNIATGSLWHRIIDFQIKGRTAATSLVLDRTYLSHALLISGDFGYHWFDRWQTRILAVDNTAGTNLIWIDQNGGAWTFIRNPNNSFTSPPGFFGTLKEFPDHWEIQKPHDIVLSFTRIGAPALIGKLTKLSEPHGESVVLSYDSNSQLSSFQTPLAGEVTYTRNALGYVSQVTRVRDGLSYQYSYDANGNLISSSDFDGNLTQYSYTSNPTNPVADRLLSSITDPLGRVTTFTFDPTKGSAISQTEPGNAVRSFAYSTDSSGLRLTKVTEIDGTVSNFHFDNNFRLVEADQPDGSIVYSQWNAQNEITSTTDELGFVTKYGYDLNGNLSSIQKPLDLKPTTIKYDPLFDKPILITPLTGAPTSFQLNPSNGDVTEVTRTGASTSLSLKLTYDAFGNRLAINNGRATYSDQTDANGLKTFIFDEYNPETLSYDVRGRVIQARSKSGRKLTFTYDNYDRLTRVDDSNGPSLLRTYDVMGRMTSQTLTDGKTNETTQFSYDARDRLVLKTDALGNTTQRIYDLPGPNSTTIVLDQPTAIVNALGKKTQFTYDNRDRLITKTDANGGLTQYSYSLRGDLLLVTDPLGKSTSFTYDGNKSLISKVEPSVISTGGKDTPAIEKTDYFYDASGKLTEEQKLSATIPGKIGVIDLAYDSFDRVVRRTLKVIAPNDTTLQDDSSFSYEPELDVARITEADNEVEKLSFDYNAQPPFANIHYSVQATDPKNTLQLVEGSFLVDRAPTDGIQDIRNQAGKTLINEVSDPAGRLLSIDSGDYFGNAPSKYSNWFGGQPNGYLKSEITYDSFGRKSLISSSDGLSGIIKYDNLNRQTGNSWSARGSSVLNFSQVVTFENIQYDAVGNLIGDEKPFSRLSYQYDALNQLTSISADNTIQPFLEISKRGVFSRNLTYDNDGNRTGDSVRGPASFIDNQIVSDSENNYDSDNDGFGNLVSQQNKSSGNTRRFAYRVDGRMIHFDRDVDLNEDIVSADYYYDALGRRVAKSLQSRPGCGHKASFNQDYLYLGNQNKILLAAGESGDQTLYLDGLGIDEHLGRVSSHGANGFVTDHLGSVLNTSAAGIFHTFGPFGESLLDSGEYRAFQEDADPVAYGFAGRQLDRESGLYYNRARMYSPELGRFTSKDPIGFAGGDLNLYRYTKNTFLSLTDPSGQCPLDQEFGVYGELTTTEKQELAAEFAGDAAALGVVFNGVSEVAVGTLALESVPDVALACAFSPSACLSVGTGIIEGLTGEYTGQVGPTSENIGENIGIGTGMLINAIDDPEDGTSPTADDNAGGDNGD